MEEEIAATRPVSRRSPEEFSSPVFAKRSRASYGPLFDDLDDDDLSVDGSRRGKGRKRPRYSVQNRMWRYREDSSSPEPDEVQEPSSPAQERTSDVGMHDAPAHADMTDEIVQTNENELPPPPSSSLSTPVKSWTEAEMSPSLRLKKSSQPFGGMDAASDTPASPSRSKPLAPQGREEDTIRRTPKNPFAASNNRWEVETEDSNAEAGYSTPRNAETPIKPQVVKSASPTQATPVRGNLSGPGVPLETGPFQTPRSVGAASNNAGVSTQIFGQTSPLFGTGPAPVPPAFAQATTPGSAFGAPAGSLRFGFGQASQPPTGESPFASTHTPATQAEINPYPKSYLDQHDRSTVQSIAPQYNYDISAQDAHSRPDPETLVTQDSYQGHPQDHSVPLWPLGSQHYDSSHVVGRIDPAEDLRSDYNVSEATPPGIIPPEVEDGTRNIDEMKQQGLLAKPVYQQGVPPEAIPGQEEVSVDKDGSMDSDDEANYDEDEKGDDYDLRNYDRISDDEEDYYDEDEEHLSGDELLDEDEQPFYGGDRGYDHNDYDEDNYEQDEAQSYFAQTSHYHPQPPAQPPKPKEPVIIDLLSDSDDEPPPPPPPKQVPQLQTSQYHDQQSPKPGPEIQAKPGFRSVELGSPLAHSESQHQDPDSEGDQEDSRGESDEDLEDDDILDEESEDAEGSEYVEDDIASADVDEADSESYEMEANPRLASNFKMAVGTPLGDASGEDGSPVTTTQTHDTADDAAVEDAVEKEPQDEIVATAIEQQTHQRSSGANDAMDVDMEKDGIENGPRLEISASTIEQQAHVRDSIANDRMDVDVDNDVEKEPQYETTVAAIVQQTHQRSNNTKNATNADVEEHSDAIGPFQSQVDNDMDAHGMLSQDSKTAVDLVESSAAEEEILESSPSEEVPALEADEPQQGPEEPLVQPQQNFTAEPTDDAKVADEEARAEAQEQLPKDSTEPSNKEAEAIVPMPSSDLPEEEVNEDLPEIGITVQKVTEHIETQANEQVETSVEVQRTDIVISQEVVPDEENQDVQMLDAENTTIDPAEQTPEIEIAAKQVNETVILTAEKEHLDEEKTDEKDSFDQAPPAVEPAKADDTVQQGDEADSEPVQDMDTGGDEVVDLAATDDRPVGEGKAFDEVGDLQTDLTEANAPKKDKVDDLPSTDNEPAIESTAAMQGPLDDAQSVNTESAAVDQQPLIQIDSNISDEDEATRENSMADTRRSVSASADASFKSVTPQASETAELNEVESTSMSKPKRGRKPRVASAAKGPKSTPSKRSQRQVSFEQGPVSQRTTRSKAMSFQKPTSPQDDKEDMSILLARAAVKSPSKTKQKAPAASSKRSKVDWSVRLENDMPDCAALKDLRKFNNRVVRLDAAVVVTSAHTQPKRTSTREYASSFTVTDPSVAPGSVIEVSLYSLHRDYLPIVKRGDSVLLRSFTVESLPGRGFGLRTEKDQSSWAVFKADGDDEPEMKAAPVELNAKETKYLLDLRSWFAELDEGAKSQLNEALEEVVQNGRQSREKN